MEPGSRPDSICPLRAPLRDRFPFRSHTSNLQCSPPGRARGYEANANPKAALCATVRYSQSRQRKFPAHRLASGCNSGTPAHCTENILADTKPRSRWGLCGIRERAIRRLSKRETPGRSQGREDAKDSRRHLSPVFLRRLGFRLLFPYGDALRKGNIGTHGVSLSGAVVQKTQTRLIRRRYRRRN